MTHRYLVEIRHITTGGRDRTWLIPTDDETWVAEMRSAADDVTQRLGVGPRWRNVDNEMRVVFWDDVLSIKVEEAPTCRG